MCHDLIGNKVLVFFFPDNCETWTDIDPSYNKNIPIRAMKWFETPSVVRYGAGNFSQSVVNGRFPLKPNFSRNVHGKLLETSKIVDFRNANHSNENSRNCWRKFKCDGNGDIFILWVLEANERQYHSKEVNINWKYSSRCLQFQASSSPLARIWKWSIPDEKYSKYWVYLVRVFNSGKCCLIRRS